MNIPILPDKNFKLQIYIGIGLIIYGWIHRFNEVEKYQQKKIEFNVEIKRLVNQSKYLDIELQEINEKSDRLSKRYAKENPLVVSDSGYIFTRTLSGDKNAMTISDSIARLLEIYNIKNKELEIKNDELEIKKYELNSLGDYVDEIDSFSMYLCGIGLLLFISGIGGWFRYEDSEEKIVNRKNLHLPTYSIRCQSCGRRFNSMVQYGTQKNEIDKNYHFCSDCYENGTFKNKSLTLDEIKNSTKKALRNKGKGRLYIRRYMVLLKNLDRWKYNNG